MSEESVARPVPEDPQAAVCACYYGWVFLGMQGEDEEETIEAVPCHRCGRTQREA